MIRYLVLALCGLVAPAQAEPPLTDGVAVSGLVSDADFYRLATCGAPPGGACQTAALRWGKPDLTIRIDFGSAPVPEGFEARLKSALLDALAEVNGTGSGISIRPTAATAADITLRPTNLPEGTVLTETPGFSGHGIMGVGYMTVWSDQTNTIQEGVILISTKITDADLPSVMLEEVTQSLGFLYDIDGPAYEGRSILSQTSNSTVTLVGQDAALLRLHYPPNP
ncbi:DUF2927 domain-containing protein [Tabrizicola piscis]|uniref:DUF2927 domain-containing protein n=1 Tax=Tabrizicola piscis TaxID=2494374 RepID=A0A3S8U360_9RHOB|nr:DUF2927 domain-containing protein [Tabrizicola piscis]AZL58037.1 DUF2927 domain-containing protein [Tabrizicola piscis]